jgi:hypothetical protein
MGAYRIDDVLAANGLPQRTTKTCANCQERRICTLSQVIGGGGGGEKTVLIKRWHPVWLCKVCRRRNLRDDSHPMVIATETAERVIKEHERKVQDGLEQLFSAARRVNEAIE